MSTPAPARTQELNWIDRYFQITERGSTVGREIRGGIVTFFAMSYILVLNPLILSTPDSTGAYLGGGTDGPNFAAVAAGTAIVAGLMSILMGTAAKFPLALAAGMGLNALIAYTIVGLPGMTWADAMGIVVLEGIIILILVLTGLREAVFRAVPQQLKVAISVGIGLFIALVGLVNAGIVRPGGTPLQLGVDGSLVGWPALVFVVGLFLILVLLVKKIRGAILIGVVTATVLAAIIEAVAHIGPMSEDNVGGWGLTVPTIDGSSILGLPDFSTLGQFSLFGAITKVGAVAAILLIFSLMLADFFDTMGTMVAVGSEADLLDEDGNPPKTKQILVVDSVAAAAGGAASVSSNTSYIESAAGVGEGARTGFASVVTGIAFLLATFLSPLVAMVPIEAVAPALVVVGFLMAMGVTGIDWKQFDIAFPAFLVIILMPFTYSITVGIGAGFIAYVVLKVAKGKVREIHLLMWVSAVLFVIYFVQGPIRAAIGI